MELFRKLIWIWCSVWTYWCRRFGSTPAGNGPRGMSSSNDFFIDHINSTSRLLIFWEAAELAVELPMSWSWSRINCTAEVSNINCADLPVSGQFRIFSKMFCCAWEIVVLPVWRIFSFFRTLDRIGSAHRASSGNSSRKYSGEVKNLTTWKGWFPPHQHLISLCGWRESIWFYEVHNCFARDWFAHHPYWGQLCILSWSRYLKWPPIGNTRWRHYCKDWSTDGHARGG